MRQQTQSNLDPGNCWQTAIACVLNVPAADLPDQVAIEAAKQFYKNAVNAFIFVHLGPRIYVDTDELTTPGVRPIGYHVIIGPTVRTEAQRAAGREHFHHAIVGLDGDPFWDPHPSRAGLLSTHIWGVVVPLPAHAIEWRKKRMAEGSMLCVCPKCVGSGAPPLQS